MTSPESKPDRDSGRSASARQHFRYNPRFARIKRFTFSYQLSVN